MSSAFFLCFDRLSMNVFCEKGVKPTGEGPGDGFHGAEPSEPIASFL